MILFGSVARGDYRPDSDIDILVVSNYRSEIWPQITDIITDIIITRITINSCHARKYFQ